MTDWHQRFMAVARQVATWSKHPDVQAGCVIVSVSNAILSTGYNGLPRGVSYRPARQVRPDRSHWYEHAERNAIFQAACHGVILRDARIYVPWFPCAACMRAIIQSGITRLICAMPHVPPAANPKWEQEFQIAQEMAQEAGLEIEYYDECAA